MEHLIENNSQCPYIDALIIGLHLDHFWRHVIGCSNKCLPEILIKREVWFWTGSLSLAFLRPIRSHRPSRYSTNQVKYFLVLGPGAIYYFYAGNPTRQLFRRRIWRLPVQEFVFSFRCIRVNSHLQHIPVSSKHTHYPQSSDTAL